MGGRGKKARDLTVLAVCALVVGTCSVNPATGERQLALIGEDQEIEMGRQASEQVEHTLGLYEGERGLRQYVDRIGQSMAQISERPDLPWSFEIMDDPTVNAFAIPGGFLYVTRGILAHFGTEAELAAVLGHEIGHVTARHSVEQMSQQQLAQLGLGLGAVFSEEIREYGQFIGAGLQLLFLSYSRDDERQADALGVRYMLEENFDPRDAMDVHRMLGRQQEAAGVGGMPTWLSTHPPPEDRIERIQALVDSVEEARLQQTASDRDRYLQQLDGLVFGQDPRNGYFRDGLFLHPRDEFRVQFPDDWETVRQGRTAAAVSPSEDAMMQIVPTGAPSNEEAARQFFGQQGIQSGQVSSGQINGHSTTSGTFQAETDQGVVEGITTFLDYGGTTYQLLGYTARGSLGQYGRTFEGAFGTFDRLTDREALSAEPMRLELITVEGGTTVEDLARSRGSPATAEELALLNGLETNESIESGRTIKWVTGERPAGQQARRGS